MGNKKFFILSLFSLIFANGITAMFAVNARTHDVLYAFFLQCLIIGFFTLLKLILVPLKPELFKTMDEPGGESWDKPYIRPLGKPLMGLAGKKIGFIACFVLMFACAVLACHGFVALYGADVTESSLSGKALLEAGFWGLSREVAGDVLNRLNGAAAFPAMLFFLTYGVSFMQSHIFGREYLIRNPVELMLEALLRISPVFLAGVFGIGTWFDGHEKAVLMMLILFKTIIESIEHIKYENAKR